MEAAALLTSIERDGFAVVPDVLDPERVADLTSTIESYCNKRAEVSGRVVHAIRNLFVEIPEAADVVDSPGVRALVEPVLGPNAFAVRAIYFDKPPGANWKVAWHQDQTIAVNRRADLPGFGPWSVKDGVQHVEPPIVILDRMLTVRIHLDDCGEENGPLRVVPGSHKLGRLAAEHTERLKKTHGESVCTVSSGGAVLIRPLILHASSESAAPTHRRVIHIEFASQALPDEIEWAGPLIPVGHVAG
ncbi:MAG: phytanoyl-CoA dioxygenase family protein [Phycisphaerales bacterium]